MDPSIPTAHARAPAAEPTAGAIGAALVLVVHDRAALTLRALIALAGADNGVRFHTLLVDDGSSDATPAIAAGVSGDFTALREERPCGFAAGADAAVTLSRQPLVVVVREDLVPTAGWLERLLAPFADPAVGAVRPRVLDLAGRDLAGACWPALALRRAAFDDVGGLCASSAPGRPAKATFTAALAEAGWLVLDEPSSVLLSVPEAASRAAQIFESR